MSFFSYTHALLAACRSVQPSYVLEWGTGASTLIIARECPNAKILSIEHSRRWHRQWVDTLRAFKQVELVAVSHTMQPGRAEGYITYPLRRQLEGGRSHQYDLIFVDGRSRCDCLVVAYLLLADDGLVVLHDSLRAAYRPGWRLF